MHANIAEYFTMVSLIEQDLSGSEISPKYNAGLGKNAKCLDGIRDFRTTSRKEGCAKILARDAKLRRKTSFRDRDDRSSGCKILNREAGLPDQNPLPDTD